MPALGLTSLTLCVRRRASGTPPPALATLQVEWEDNSAIEDGYRIRWEPSAGGAELQADTAANVESYTIAGLAWNTQYDVTITAVNGVGESDVLGPVALYTPPPSAPTVCTATATGATTATIGWTLPGTEPVTGYRVYRSPAGAGTWTAVGVVAAGVNTYAATGLTASTAYDFRVVAYNSNAGESQPDSETAPSNTASCTTSAGGPGQVAADDFESYAADANLGAEANWDAVVGAFIVKDVSGAKYATGNSGTANSAVVWAGAGTFTSDQYVEFQIRWNGSTGYIAGSTRHQPGVETYYRVLAIPNSSQIRIDKYVNGVQTVGTPVSQGLATGNWVRMETTGTAAGNAVRNTVKVDTGSGYSTVINAEDPGVYMDNGKPGMSSYDNNYNASVAQWRAGNI